MIKGEKGVLELTERNEQKRKNDWSWWKKTEEKKMKKILSNFFAISRTFFFYVFFGLFTVDKRELFSKKVSSNRLNTIDKLNDGAFFCTSFYRLTSITRTTNEDRRRTKKINVSKSFLQLWENEKEGRRFVMISSWIFSQDVVSTRWGFAELLSKRKKERKQYQWILLEYERNDTSRDGFFPLELRLMSTMMIVID